MRKITRWMPKAISVFISNGVIMSNKISLVTIAVVIVHIVVDLT